MDLAKPFAVLIVLLSTLSFAMPMTGQDLLSSKKVRIESGPRGSVVVFLSAKCPCSNSHLPILKKLYSEFKDFSFVTVHSNRDEDIAMSKEYFTKAGLPFPVSQEDKAAMANSLKAYKTPHAFVFSPQGKILYKGGVTGSAVAQNDSQEYLREALEDIRLNREVRTPEGRTLGCVISRD